MGVLVQFHLERRGQPVLRKVLMPPDYRLDSIEQTSLHCAIVDLSLPPPRCWQIAEAIRSTPELEAVPLIVSLWSVLDVGKLRRLHPCTWLAKPYSMDMLFRAVEDPGGRQPRSHGGIPSAFWLPPTGDVLNSHPPPVE